MGRLIVVEGLDGAGKRTLADGLVAALTAAGRSVATMAFPRYGQDVHADLVREALRGEHGDAADSVYGMALLYALDRRDAAERLRVLVAAHDVVLLDRYVASNAAYGAARLRQPAAGGFVSWVRRTEIDRFGVPVPDRHLLLRVPAALAAERAERRERTEALRVRDAFESDGDLQRRCGTVYDALAESGWLAPWRVLDGGARQDLAALADWACREA